MITKITEALPYDDKTAAGIVISELINYLKDNGHPHISSVSNGDAYSIRTESESLDITPQHDGNSIIFEIKAYATPLGRKVAEFFAIDIK